MMFSNLLLNPSLQLVHFGVELLQALDSAQGPLLIGGRLFQRLPLVLELAQLLPHQIRGGVHLADQLLTHLWRAKDTWVSTTQIFWPDKRRTVTERLWHLEVWQSLLICSNLAHKRWKAAINFLDFGNPCPASALPGLSECQGRLIISNVPFPNIFPWGGKYKLAWQSCLEHWGFAFPSGWLE